MVFHSIISFMPCKHVHVSFCVKSGLLTRRVHRYGVVGNYGNGNGCAVMRDGTHDVVRRRGGIRHVSLCVGAMPAGDGISRFLRRLRAKEKSRITAGCGERSKEYGVACRSPEELHLSLGATLADHASIDVLLPGRSRFNVFDKRIGLFGDCHRRRHADYRRYREADCLCRHGSSFPFFSPRAPKPQAAGILHYFSFSRQGAVADFKMNPSQCRLTGNAAILAAHLPHEKRKDVGGCLARRERKRSGGERVVFVHPPPPPSHSRTVHDARRPNQEPSAETVRTRFVASSGGRHGMFFTSHRICSGRLSPRPNRHGETYTGSSPIHPQRTGSTGSCRGSCR